jgi:hypothetical protein|tara:strand:- start:1112 stop:1282 length:171 start_codon:yes stop_codon:yes gene_type:complete
MAKITVARLPQSNTGIVDSPTFNTLIRELEQIITQLNFGYQQDTKDETLARNWFIG